MLRIDEDMAQKAAVFCVVRARTGRNNADFFLASVIGDVPIKFSKYGPGPCSSRRNLIDGRHAVED